MNRQIPLKQIGAIAALAEIETLLAQSAISLSPSGGAGTLVRYKNIQGILTTTHRAREVGGKIIEADACDICLLQLNEEIPDGKVVIDLEEHQARFLADPAKFVAPLQAINWSWSIYALPRDIPDRFEGLYLSDGTYKNEVCVHTVLPSQEQLIANFSGIEGSGVTQISLGCGEDGVIKIVDHFFSGVVILGGVNVLESRGPKALYETFLRHLDQQTR